MIYSHFANNYGIDNLSTFIFNFEETSPEALSYLDSMTVERTTLDRMTYFKLQCFNKKKI